MDQQQAGRYASLVGKEFADVVDEHELALVLELILLVEQRLKKQGAVIVNYKEKYVVVRGIVGSYSHHTKMPVEMLGGRNAQGKPDENVVGLWEPMKLSSMVTIIDALYDEKA